MFPTDVTFEKNFLQVTWDDGHKSIYAPSHLRLACSCAQCVDELTGQRTIRPEHIPADIKPQELRPVGRYGVSIQWSDGHGTGIYTFERLRELCECELCNK